MTKTDIVLRTMTKISNMVLYMKSKNIKSEKCSEKNAEIYLRENNNYFDKIIVKKL